MKPGNKNGRWTGLISSGQSEILRLLNICKHLKYFFRFNVYNFIQCFWSSEKELLNSNSQQQLDRLMSWVNYRERRDKMGGCRSWPRAKWIDCPGSCFWSIWPEPLANNRVRSPPWSSYSSPLGHASWVNNITIHQHQCDHYHHNIVTLTFCCATIGWHGMALTCLGPDQKWTTPRL